MDDSEAEGGFSQAFDRCAPSVLRFARRRLEDRDAAWDVVNETFTTAWRHWDQRPADRELLPWLYAIARNAVRDELRSAGRRSRLAARLSATSQARYTADSADGVVLGRSGLRGLMAEGSVDQPPEAVDPTRPTSVRSHAWEA